MRVLCGAIRPRRCPPGRRCNEDTTGEEHRFKALCLLAAGALYVGLVAAVAALCGEFGVLMVVILTFVAVMSASI